MKATGKWHFSTSYTVFGDKNVIKSLRSSFTLRLYKHYMLQDVEQDLYVIQENASLPAGDVTKKTIVVITVTNNIVVCIYW